MTEAPRQALKAGPLAGQDLSLLKEGSSVVRSRTWGAMAVVESVDLGSTPYIDITLDGKGAGGHANEHDYIGERGEDGWISWSGGENPVPGMRVQTRWRNGKTWEFNSDDTANVDWQHLAGTPESDIIAFRPVPALSSQGSGGDGALERVRACVASVEGVYGFDDDVAVNTKHFGPDNGGYNDFAPMTWGDLRAALATLPTPTPAPSPVAERKALYGYSYAYTTDPEGLERMRTALAQTPDWHDRAPINCNSLARLLDTIELLSAARTGAEPVAEEDVSRANLISAAPDLLKAAVAMVEGRPTKAPATGAFGKDSIAYRNWEKLDALRAAINKARTGGVA